jgi:serine/threonine-protein kinase HipA
VSEWLSVFHGVRHVGVLRRQDDGLSFEYAKEWLDDAEAFSISISLPLVTKSDPRSSRNFFANLLPEASVRVALCRRLGISEGNDFALLEAIGGECAGALTILPDGASPDARSADYEPISTEQLAELAKAHAVLPTLDGREGVRLSLAGAQDKLPVLEQDGRYYLPLGSSPSTHILKFPNRLFKHLPANEVLMTELARRVGLPAVSARWVPIGREGLCAVTRYDRVHTQHGVERLHQEDLCQALGVSPLAKYESEGGPSFVRCVDVVRAHSYEPFADTNALLRWQAFNVVVGNADAHAKNLSLLWDDGWRLAPFYDLVCTRSYDRIDRRLAMAVGGETDPDRVRRSELDACAREIEVKAGWFVEMVRATAEAVVNAFDEAAAASGTVSSPALTRIAPVVRKQARRLVRELGG